MSGNNREKLLSAEYSTSNSIYGWRPPKNARPAEEISKLWGKNRTEEENNFIKTFWHASSSEYGEFGYKRNSLTNAMDDLLDVKRTKHVTRDSDGPSGTKVRINDYELSFKDYQIDRKVEHKIYTTTSNEIGAKKPHFPVRMHPHWNDFTRSFAAGMQRDCGLNTSIPKNRFIEDHKAE